MRNTDKLESVFADVMKQVTAGKGAERHGHDRDFLKQPWHWIADGFGEGFLLGQAVKKMHEATHSSGWEHERWEREMLGAIAYIGFAVVNRRLTAQKIMDALDKVAETTVALNFDPGLPGAWGTGGAGAAGGIGGGCGAGGKGGAW